jgi:hypothetical protein
MMSEALVQLATAHRQMLEFRISFGLQATQLLTRPVLEDPDASEWHVDKGRAIAEGKVVARGEGWSVLEMIVYTTEEYEGEPMVYRARINAVPNRTTYDFGGSIIDVRPDYFEYDDYARGCNPATGVSFEIAPVITEDGVEQQTRCWPKPQIPSDADPEARAEFEASFRLQCHQMIERMRIP